MKTGNYKIKITPVISFAAFLLMMIILPGFQCSKDKLAGISPARDISGTWTTPAPVTLYMTSEGCGTYKRYNSTPVKMTWEITAVDDNNVDIRITATYIGTTTQLASNCGMPALLNFPFSLHGRISSSNLKLLENQMQYNSSGGAIGLKLIEVGNFNLTTNILTGTIYEKNCPILCIGYETDANKCILIK